MLMCKKDKTCFLKRSSSLGEDTHEYTFLHCSSPGTLFNLIIHDPFFSLHGFIKIPQKFSPCSLECCDHSILTRYNASCKN